MFQNQYQNQYQYPNQFGGFQNHVIEPPMPTNMPKSSGGNFWYGFIAGILTAIIIGVGIELFKRFRLAQKPVSHPLPNPNAKEKTIEVNSVKTIPEEISNIFEISRPLEKQTFDQFIAFIETQGFELDEESQGVTNNEVFRDGNGNEIHIGNVEFTVKSANSNPVVFNRKDALFVEFNENLLKYFFNENQN